MLRVAVLGAEGRLGRVLCAAIDAADDLELVAMLGRADARDALDACDVALDVTHPSAVADNVRACVERGVSVVVGTSGWTDEHSADVAQLLDAHPAVGVLVAPSFSVGAVLMTRLAALAAPHVESVEIVEAHHPDKADAPSGTARRTAEVIAAARGGATNPDATTEALDGARGATVHGIPVHSVRLRGVIAAQEVLLGSPGEVLTIRHDALDRSSFVPGALLALRAVRDRPGLTIGLDALLF